MILISIFIQIHSIDNETSIKKFVYLMIDDIERQNNIKKSIESTRTYDHVIARESIAQSVAVRTVPRWYNQWRSGLIVLDL